MMEELKVLQRIVPLQAVALVELYSSLVTIVNPGLPLPLCRDSDDDKFIECAVAAGVDFLISRDQDLLAVRVVGAVRIVSPAEFLQSIS